MTSWKRLLVTALVDGFAASVVLAAIEALYHSDIIAIAQFPGIVVAWEIAYGGGSAFAIEVVIVLVNAACYFALFGGLLVLARTVKKALVHE